MMTPQTRGPRNVESVCVQPLWQQVEDREHIESNWPRNSGYFSIGVQSTLTFILSSRCPSARHPERTAISLVGGKFKSRTLRYVVANHLGGTFTEQVRL